MTAKNKKSKVTIAEIAKKLGVSAATVSNALTGERFVKTETKEKVQRLAKELNYKPNLVARALLSKKRNIIGLLVPNINNAFYSEIIAGFEEIISEHGYTLMMNSTHYDTEAEIENLKKFTSLMVDGLVFVGGVSKIDHLEDLITDEIPVLFLNRNLSKPRYTQVIVDYNKAVKKAVKHLYDLGHKKIGYIGWKSKEILVSEEKYNGYIDGLKENNLEINKDYIFLKDEVPQKSIREYYEFTQKIYDKIKKEKISAVITQTDQIALAVLNYLKDIKIEVPGALSVIGIGNINQTGYTTPGLTTINLPKKRMGRFGAELMLKLISENKNKDQVIYLKTTLIKRESAIKLDQ
jgi:DNA-binding LacI/PurR family transcriptional regulator